MIINEATLTVQSQHKANYRSEVCGLVEILISLTGSVEIQKSFYWFENFTEDEGKNLIHCSYEVVSKSSWIVSRSLIMNFCTSYMPEQSMFIGISYVSGHGYVVTIRKIEFLTTCVRKSAIVFFLAFTRHGHQVRTTRKRQVFSQTWKVRLRGLSFASRSFRSRSYVSDSVLRIILASRKEHHLWMMKSDLEGLPAASPKKMYRKFASLSTNTFVDRSKTYLGSLVCPTDQFE